MWPYALALTGYLIWNYYKTGKDFAEKFTVKLHTVKFDLAKTATSLFTKLFFDVVVYINNPTAFSARATGSSFRIFYNGALVSTAVSTGGSLELKAQSETPIKLSVGVSVLNIAATAKSIIEKLKTGQSVAVRVQGEINTTAGTFKFDEVRDVI